MGALTDATRLAAKERLKAYLETHMKDPEGVKFMIEMFDASYDLISDSIEHGGLPEKGDVIRYFVKKSNVGVSTLTTNQMAQCVSTVVSLGVTLSKFPQAAGKGAVGMALFIPFALYDGLTMFEECDLAYLEVKGDAKVRAFKRALEDSRKQRKTQVAPAPMSLPEAIQTVHIIATHNQRDFAPVSLP